MSRSAILLGTLGAIGLFTTLTAQAGPGCGSHSGGSIYAPTPHYPASRPVPPVYHPPVMPSPAYPSHSPSTYPTPQPPMSRTTAPPTPRPIPADPSRIPVPPAVPTESVATGLTAFKARNLGEALRIAHKLVGDNPQDADKLQFRSIVYLALGNHKAAAADAYDAALQGRLWTVETLQGLYESPATYHQDMTLLRTSLVEGLKAQEIDRAVVRPKLFLLAYHEAVVANYPASRDALAVLLKIVPDDQVASGLLAAVESKIAARPAGPSTAQTASTR